MAPDEARGWVPVDDNYFLGQLQFDDEPRLRPLGRREQQRGMMVRILSRPPNPADAFAAMVAPDWRGLERKRYEFKYVRREFLGESRCFVFDVKPLRNGKGFVGRIWIEDRDYNLVRFNGASHGSEETLSGMLKRTLSFHMDGWRVNVAPGVWVPSYVYSEETDLSSASSSSAKTKQQARFRSQTRIWGYQAQNADRTDSLTTIRIDEAHVADTTEGAAQLSPVLSQRRWEQEAEANVLERLEAIGLLAPAGEADKVLETVLNNLVVTNTLNLERPLRSRILLTSPLESFTVGHTIVLSRGLIDVLPDEASLATMLAHELSHVALGHQLIDTKFSFADRLMVPDDELLQALRFRRTPKEEAAADEKVIELLGKSPYRDKLADAGPVSSDALGAIQAVAPAHSPAHRRLPGGQWPDDTACRTHETSPGADARQPRTDRRAPARRKARRRCVERQGGARSLARRASVVGSREGSVCGDAADARDQIFAAS